MSLGTSLGLYAKVVCDSISPDGVRLTTLQGRAHRFCWAEFLTHRVFSRNASSSRAIPVEKMIEEVRTNPAMPVYWGKNQRGMQAREELGDEEIHCAVTEWNMVRNTALMGAQHLVNLNVHKQLVNRILEPFMWIDFVVTATEWDNFYALRRHADAQPEIKALADAMYAAMEESEPGELQYGEWHLPYVNGDTRNKIIEHVGENTKRGFSVYMPRYHEACAKVSAARCARVSYRNHDGTTCDIEKDLALAARLLESKHMSPFEHQAYAAAPAAQDYDTGEYSGFRGNQLFYNLRGWVSQRYELEKR
jgi:thymidylate synthase ThyX